MTNHTETDTASVLPPKNKYQRHVRPSQPGMAVQVRLQPDRLKMIDDWRRQQPDLPNRAEAIRRLVEMEWAALRLAKPR